MEIVKNLVKVLGRNNSLMKDTRALMKGTRALMKDTRAKHAMHQSIFQSSSQSRDSSSQASSTQASSTTSPPIPTNPQPFTLLSTTKCPSSGSHTLTFSDPSSYHARLPVPTGVKFHRVTKQGENRPKLHFARRTIVTPLMHVHPFTPRFASLSHLPRHPHQPQPHAWKILFSDIPPLLLPHDLHNPRQALPPLPLR